MGLVFNSIDSNYTFQIYNEKGFVVEKNFFDKDELVEIYCQITQVFWIQARRLGLADISMSEEDYISNLFNHNFEVFKNCGKQIQHLIDVWKLSTSDTLVNYLINTLKLSFPNICTRPVVMLNSPRFSKNEVNHTVPFHQDAKSMQGSDDAVVVWFPLVNTGIPLGALKVIPGSHKLGVVAEDINEHGFGYVKDKYIEKDKIISLPCSLGDVVFFNSRLIHSSGTNSTEKARVSCQFRYNNLDDSSFKEKGYPHPYAYYPIKKD